MLKRYLSPAAPPTQSSLRRRWLIGGLFCAATAAAMVAGWQGWLFFKVQPAPASGREWLDAREPEEIASPAPPTPPVAALRDEAAGMLGRLLDRFPDNAPALDAVARYHERFGHTRQAIKCWRRCAQLDPGFAPAYQALGRIASDQGQPAEAACQFRKAAEADPQLPGILVELTDALTKSGDLSQAAAAARQNLQRDPRFFPSLYQLGEIHLARKEYREARKYLEAAVQSSPDSVNACFALATACTRLNDAEKAKQYLKRFQDLKARERQEHRELLKSLDGLSDTREKVADLYTLAAKVYLLAGDLETAEKHLVEAARHNAEQGAALQLLAWIYQQQGRREEARNILAARAAHAPKDLGVYVDLGRLCAEMGRFEEAERAYRSALDLVPDRAMPYVALADLYLKAGRKLAEARRLAAKAAELDASPSCLRLLALACQRNGDQAGANAAMARARSRAAGRQEPLRTPTGREQAGK
jgi:tetratricopeptide (TPR) repeat protein